MSKLAEVYSLGCGVPLDRPEMMDTFFPISHPLDKTILIHAFAGGIKNENGQFQAAFPAKIYDYFNEVVDLLVPLVEKHGYKIFQIGAPGEPNLKRVESLAGRTTMAQCAYLVKHCAILIGNDSMWSHLAGAYDKPQVTVYGPTSTPHIPYWKSDKSSFLESHRKGGKPSYTSHENPKTINWIPPELIANDSLKILSIDEKVSRKSLFFGDTYNQHVIELVPNTIIDPNLQITGPLVIRMDYEHNENVLASNVQFRKCSIMLDKEISLGLLTQLKPNIVALRIEVDKLDTAWIKAVKKLGIPTGFFSSPTMADLSDLRLKLYDACLFDKFQPPTIEEFMVGAKNYLNKDLDNDLKMETLKFRTNKFLLSDNKIYLSRAHWKAGKHTESSDVNWGSVINSPEFWEEQAHFYIYSE